MKKLYKIHVMLISALVLTGCDDPFVSQTPVMSEFTQKSPEWIYREGENAREDRKYNTAISTFRAFIKLHRDHKYIQQARMALIDCYIACGQYEDALLGIDDFIRLHSDSIVHCSNLKEKKIVIKRKQKMDWIYHLAWLQDVKNQHSTNYRILARAVDTFSE